MVGTERRSSILDHIYIKEPTLVSNLKYVNPFFGDHVLVEFIIDAKKCEAVLKKCRDWRNYSKDLLNTKLAGVDWNINISDVQQYWNMFENLLINVVDEIVPMAVFEGNIYFKTRISQMG